MNLLKKNYNLIQRLCFFKRYAVLLVVLLFPAQQVFAQQFTVLATPTHESCPGNGILTLSTDNEDPASPVNYKVYLLPDTSSPFFNSSSTSVTGLNNGTYLVVATQDVNGNDVQDTIEVTINDETIPLTYALDGQNALCGADGVITVNVTSGTAVTYELISGPMTLAPQTSNVLGNLLAGQYVVRVTNNCGTGIVVTFLLESDASLLVVSPPMFTDKELPACDLITVAHDLTTTEEDMEAQTPITVKYTVYPPDGSSPFVYTHTLTELVDGPDVSQVIPFYYDTPYYYDLEVTDACGNSYNKDNNLVHQRLTVTGNYGNAGCPGKFLQITVRKFVAPYTITFTQPQGFDPAAYNADHPGPFFTDVTSYGREDGDLPGIAVPYGNYSFSVTDACGRTVAVNNLLIEEDEIHPSVSAVNSNCLNGMGGVTVGISGYEIVSAFITEAPEAYPHELDDDVSEYIDEEFKVKIENLLPPGDYTIVVIDECGREFTEEFTVGTSTLPSISANVRPDCTPGLGSAAISSTNDVIKVIITHAPVAFSTTYPLPHDASYNIGVNGNWYMNSLPPGQYKFLVDDQCLTAHNEQRNVPAYGTTLNELTITRNCGSFDLLLQHTTSASVFVKYWLQKEIGPGQWGHPETGEAYTEGDEANEDNSVLVTNNITMPTLPYRGKFRIVKSFATFGTGRTDDNIEDTPDCIEIIHDEFSFYDTLDFISIQNLTCEGDVADVQVTFLGAEPITYQITEKNGQPFFLDNGTNNIFENLEAAQYTITAEDPCGYRTPHSFSVADLPPLVTAATPDDIKLCDEGYDSSETFDLSNQATDILDGQNPANYTISYHLNLQDAEAGTNELPLSYNTATATIFARVINNINTSCNAITNFKVIVLPKPKSEIPDTFTICEGEDIRVYADPGYVYKWDGVPGGPFLDVSQAGTHTLTITNAAGCEDTKSFTVNTSSAPAIASIEITDWTDSGNTITVITEETQVPGYYEYSLDGITFQQSNVFTGLAPGAYTVYVRDTNECGADTDEVYLLTYPKFFTPNGDGINDFWRIAFSANEPNMLIYIYDRYGKIVSSFDAMGTGWDGTLNGYRLPATDYWFVVKRENGQEYKGHFSMMR